MVGFVLGFLEAHRFQVVQYILDLNDNRFSDAVIRQFSGNVCALSVQKFSSNVIEKVCFLSNGSCVANRGNSVFVLPNIARASFLLRNF